MPAGQRGREVVPCFWQQGGPSRLASDTLVREEHLACRHVIHRGEDSPFRLPGHLHSWRFRLLVCHRQTPLSLWSSRPSQHRIHAKHAASYRRDPDKSRAGHAAPYSRPEGAQGAGQVPDWTDRGGTSRLPAGGVPLFVSRMRVIIDSRGDKRTRGGRPAKFPVLHRGRG